MKISTLSKFPKIKLVLQDFKSIFFSRDGTSVSRVKREYVSCLLYFELIYTTYFPFFYGRLATINIVTKNWDGCLQINQRGFHPFSKILNAFYTILTFHFKYQVLRTCKQHELKKINSSVKRCVFFLKK